MAAFGGWAAQLLHAIGAPVTAQNMRALIAWQRAEGGSARFNPLNTTQPAHGASAYNSVGVRNYGSAAQGLNATAKTLLNGRYGNIVNLFRSGKASAEQIATAVAASPWGTGKGVLRVLGAGPVPVPKPGARGHVDVPAGAGSRNLDMARNLVAGYLFQSAQNQLEGRPTDPSSLASLALARSQMMAADREPAPAPTQPRKSGGGVSGTKGLDGRINELFYDPLGGIKYGKEIGAIGHHSDHVHVSLNNARAMQQAEAYARQLGLHVGEERDSDVHPVHVKTSFHYQRFPGTHLRKAADVSGNAKAMAAYYRWVKQHFG